MMQRNILIAVSGLSPQILTETVWALTQNETPWIPHEIHLISTQSGAERSRMSLLHPETGGFLRLCKEYQLPPITFTEQHIHVLTDAQGNPLDDVRTPEDNRIAADFITTKLQHFTCDPNTALHVSIAGGRKTMGFYLGYALSLYGRPQDRLSHILVNEPFEGSFDFYYPTKESNIIKVRHGSDVADTKQAHVTLALIPFVSLRHGIPTDLLNGQATFNQTVLAIQQSFAPLRLQLQPKRGGVWMGSTWVHLPPLELALLALFARRILRKDPPLTLGRNNAVLADDLIKEYRLAKPSIGRMGDIPDTFYQRLQDMDEFITHTRSKLHRTLKKALGQRLANTYFIQSQGRRPTYYFLDLPPEAIQFDYDTSPTRP